jgi:2-polyprenyl-3-methyl-5-hydroxy-6-metoxy-1,4-benzoquinol methylase
MQVAEFFDTAYRHHERYWWQADIRHSTNPFDYRTSLLTQELLRLIADRDPEQAPGRRALDLGAGEGADAIRLARLGYDVDAVELSSIGAQKITRFAAAEGMSERVNVHRADASAFTPPWTYGVVISNGLLHYVQDKESLIRVMQAATEPGGLNVISLWSTFTPLPACHDIIPTYLDDEDGIVVKLYEDWQTEFIYFDRDKSESAHSDFPSHRHSHIKLITRKA